MDGDFNHRIEGMPCHRCTDIKTVTKSMTEFECVNENRNKSVLNVIIHK